MSLDAPVQTRPDTLPEWAEGHMDRAALVHAYNQSCQALGALEATVNPRPPLCMGRTTDQRLEDVRRITADLRNALFGGAS